ncbi:MAG: magnesium transporter [Actinobacteria bacterium]|nr:MAG: magnesium transporter [Actinomycetota bacterium]
MLEPVFPQRRLPVQFPAASVSTCRLGIPLGRRNDRGTRCVRDGSVEGKSGKSRNERGVCRLKEPVLSVASTDFAALHERQTVGKALEEVRSRGLGERIVYFYVVDDDGALVGVLPTRRILTSDLQRRLSEVMTRQVVTIPETATVLEAHEALAKHKLLALPVVDEDRHILGVVDVGTLMDEELEVTERERMEEVFEIIGFRVSQVRGASPVRAFRFRFPWLSATIASGVIAALTARAYEATLAQSLLLAFFLTLVLGLGESVSAQSMTLTIQALRSARPGLSWYLHALRREAGTALLLGGACGLIVGSLVWLWTGTQRAAAAIGGGILLASLAASIIGLSIPALLHAVRLDPKVAAGPIALALTDVFTILVYLSLASVLL